MRWWWKQVKVVPVPSAIRHQSATQLSGVLPTVVQLFSFIICPLLSSRAVPVELTALVL